MSLDLDTKVHEIVSCLIAEQDALSVIGRRQATG